MRPLHHHIIVYDQDCPMCQLYTRAFIQTSLLDSDGRVAYHSAPANITRCIDQKRACDEIALVNTQTGTVDYGMDSLFKIIGHRFRVFHPLFQSTAFRYVINHLYKFVSYNRKVIAPGKVFEAPGSCTPSLNIPYRMAYLFLTWLFTSWVLTIYASRLAGVIPPTDLGREFLICGGQLVFQGTLVGFLRRDRLIHYLGNLMTVSTIGALLLLPVSFLPVGLPILLGWFACVVGTMFILHLKRVHLLNLPLAVSVSWVVYRLLVLVMIL